MKKEKPTTYVIPNCNNVDHVAECARLCYASNPADNQRLYDRLIRDGHLSMLRHETHYYKIPTKKIGGYYQQYFKENPYCGYAAPGDKHVYIVVNGQWLYEHKDTIVEKLHMRDYEVWIDEFEKHPDTFKLIRLTFCVYSQIAITRELNRVSPNNIAERSTRFIDFLRKLGIRFSIPHWYEKANIYRKALTNVLLKLSEWSYKVARSKYGLNLKAEDARGFLNLMTESCAAYTYSIKEWMHIIDLRYYGMTGKPHPDAFNAVKPIYHYIHQMISKDSKLWTETNS